MDARRESEPAPMKNRTTVERKSDRELVVTRTFDAPPRIENGTTYVPLRFVSEALGAQVAWQSDTRTVVIQGQ